MSDADLVLLDIADGVATLTLHRPESLNAWTPAMEDRWSHRRGPRVLPTAPAMIKAQIASPEALGLIGHV